MVASSVASPSSTSWPVVSPRPPPAPARRRVSGAVSSATAGDTASEYTAQSGCPATAALFVPRRVNVGQRSPPIELSTLRVLHESPQGRAQRGRLLQVSLIQADRNLSRCGERTCLLIESLSAAPERASLRDRPRQASLAYLKMAVSQQTLNAPYSTEYLLPQLRWQPVGEPLGPIKGSLSLCAPMALIRVLRWTQLA